MGQLRFREVMSGYVAFGPTDPSTGATAGRAVPLTMHGTVTIADMGAFVAEVDHTGGLDVRLDWLPVADGLTATRGVFKLFTPGDVPGLKLMVYEWTIVLAGRTYLFAGRKELRVHPLSWLWHDTTTLYVRVHDGDSSDAPIVGAGVICLTAGQFARMMFTFRPDGTLAARLKTLFVFSRFFVARLWAIYVIKRSV